MCSKILKHGQAETFSRFFTLKHLFLNFNVINNLFKTFAVYFQLREKYVD